MMKRSALVLVAMMAASFPASAVELEETLVRLMAGLDGAFDSGPQLAAEKLSGTPQDKQHVRVHRAFVRIDAPDVGDNVFVVTLRDGGPDGPIDMIEFQLWTLEIDKERNAVKMAPQRFKDPERYAAIGDEPEKMKGLKASQLVPSEGAAACSIYWRAVDEMVHGASGKPCLGAVRPGRPVLSWEWTYILGDDALWMSFAGRGDDGEVVFGRQDQLPWRLDKVN
ncbi:MAG: hypothetical protein GKS03_03615 [Alphaproteobacteria bacterium]|nr:hypothetical protein [Alphaproteobacteria bacterium]